VRACTEDNASAYARISRNNVVSADTTAAREISIGAMCRRTQQAAAQGLSTGAMCRRTQRTVQLTGLAKEISIKIGVSRSRSYKKASSAGVHHYGYYEEHHRGEQRCRRTLHLGESGATDKEVNCGGAMDHQGKQGYIKASEVQQLRACIRSSSTAARRRSSSSARRLGKVQECITV
jgi:hypothetical protein